MRGTEGAPTEVTGRPVDKPVRLEQVDGDDVRCAAPLTGEEIVVIGRRGGPEFLDSELARLGHLAALAASISPRLPGPIRLRPRARKSRTADESVVRLPSAAPPNRRLGRRGW